MEHSPLKTAPSRIASSTSAPPPEGSTRRRACTAGSRVSFGSVDAVREQEIVKVTNLVTLEGSIFNGLRASRPSDTGTDTGPGKRDSRVRGRPVLQPGNGDARRHLRAASKANTRLPPRTSPSTTASTASSSSTTHNPLHFTPEKVADYINVGLQWGRKAYEGDPEARYFFLMWNCLWRAGGSIIHGPRPRPPPPATCTTRKSNTSGAPPQRLRSRLRRELFRRPLPRPRVFRSQLPLSRWRARLRQPHPDQRQRAYPAR